MIELECNFGKISIDPKSFVSIAQCGTNGCRIAINHCVNGCGFIVVNESYEAVMSKIKWQSSGGSENNNIKERREF